MDKIKAAIIETAVEAYAAHPTIAEICEKAGVTSSAFYDHFESMADVYREAYRYFLHAAALEAKGLPGYEQNSFEERLASVIFVFLDVLEANSAFAEDTYFSYAAPPGSRFQALMPGVLSSLMTAPDISQTNRVLFDNTLWRFMLGASMVHLVGKWIKDDTDNKERSLALVDRSIALWSEILANRVPERTVDLIRYCVEANYIPVKDIPFVRDWFRKEEEGTEDNEPGK